MKSFRSVLKLPSSELRGLETRRLKGTVRRYEKWRVDGVESIAGLE